MALVDLINTKEGLAKLPEKLKTDVVVAEVHEEGLGAYQDKDWRHYFSQKLSGRGLEIGPLHRPMPVFSGQEIDYFDRYTAGQLRERYPELADLPLLVPDLIGDAQLMNGVSNGVYDFLTSSHVLEHMRNPILAIEHWFRVLKPCALLYLVVPDKRMIFDTPRLRTSLEHLIIDYREPSAERDFEHYLDFAVFVNEKRGIAAIKEADRLLAEDYSIHFHVFIPSDVKELLEWFSENVSPIQILEGPAMAPGGDEFHFLLKNCPES